MEEIQFELNLLKKFFPFIKFEFIQPDKDIRILINNNGTNDYYFYYNSNKLWRIWSVFSTNNLNKFLDKFIYGLIYWGLY